MKVGRVYTFWAWHSLPLPGFDETHKHFYTVEVEGEGDAPYALDMEAWDARLRPLKDANLDGQFQPSTVEQIAQTLLSELEGATAVRVQEDTDRWARAE